MMIEIDEAELQAAFATGSTETRAMLVALFPLVVFPLDITERVTTIAEACTITGVNLANVNAITLPDGLNQTAIKAFIKLSIIHQALNDGWVADASDITQVKCYVWQEFLSEAALINGAPFMAAGGMASSALCLALKDEMLARYSGTQFLSLWQDLAVIDSLDEL